jgi:hypothetical protein
VAKKNPLKKLGPLSDPADVMANCLWLYEDLERDSRHLPGGGKTSSAVQPMVESDACCWHSSETNRDGRR